MLICAMKLRRDKAYSLVSVFGHGTPQNRGWQITVQAPNPAMTCFCLPCELKMFFTFLMSFSKINLKKECGTTEYGLQSLKYLSNQMLQQPYPPKMVLSPSFAS